MKTKTNVNNGLLFEVEKLSTGRTVHRLANWVQQYKNAAEMLNLPKVKKAVKARQLAIFAAAEEALTRFTVTGNIEICNL